MTAEKKIAQKRLSLLQLAKRLRNVSGACRRREVSRSQFYAYKRAFQKRGTEGLVDRAPVPKSCPHETPVGVRERVIAVSLERPARGVNKIYDFLRLEGMAVSPSTIRNVWVTEGLATNYKRLLRLEEKSGREVELSEEQIRLLERGNPCFRERKVESPYPRYLLSQDTFHVRTIKGVGRIWLQAVVNTYGAFAFGKLYTSKLPRRRRWMCFMTGVCLFARIRVEGGAYPYGQWTGVLWAVDGSSV